MNRHERRAAKAKARNALVEPVDPVVAFHEAGHAVARYLTAEMMGVPPERSVSSIVVHVPETVSKGKSVDGKMDMAAQATTFGPMFSDEIAAVSKAMIEENAWTSAETVEKMNSLDIRRELMQRAREQGCDVERWLRARAREAVAGALAESIYRQVPFGDVWEGYEAEDDRRSFVGDAMTLGLDDEELATVVNEALDDAFEWFKDQVLNNPGVRIALNAVAQRINRPGTISGPIVVGIIENAMGDAR